VTASTGEGRGSGRGREEKKGEETIFCWKGPTMIT